MESQTTSQPELTPQQKLALAQQDLEKWSPLAANPDLSPEAATVAMNAARSAAAEIKLRQKGLAYQAAQPGGSTTFQMIDRQLMKIGKPIADLWCVLAAIIILFGFPVSGFLAALYIGMMVGNLFGFSGFFAIAIAFVIGLFLSIYVWQHHVQARVMAACDAIRPHGD